MAQKKVGNAGINKFFALNREEPAIKAVSYINKIGTLHAGNGAKRGSNKIRLFYNTIVTKSAHRSFNTPNNAYQAPQEPLLLNRQDPEEQFAFSCSSSKRAPLRIDDADIIPRFDSEWSFHLIDENGKSGSASDDDLTLHIYGHNDPKAVGPMLLSGGTLLKEE